MIVQEKIVRKYPTFDDVNVDQESSTPDEFIDYKEFSILMTR